MVRARSLIDGMVIPHRDFVELDRSKHYFRVFVPLETNEEAFHSDESGVFQMQIGEVWFLDAAINHAAINFGSKSRMFLCLDYIFTKEFQHTDILLSTAKFEEPRAEYLITRTPLGDKQRDEIIRGASTIINRRTFKDLVFALSKYHFIYDVEVAECYDWIVRAAELDGDQEVIQKATLLRKYLIEKRDMGERYIINDWAA